MHQLKTIKELLYSVGDMEKVAYFFRDYGGLEEIGSYESNRNQLDFWKLPEEASGQEMLLQSDSPASLISDWKLWERSD